MIETKNNQQHGKYLIPEVIFNTQLEPCVDYTNIVHSLQVCVKSLSGQGISSVKGNLA